MRPGSKDESASPLDEVLRQLPQEEPPADLQARCVSALRRAAAEHPPRRVASLWPTVIKSAAGLAAAFLLVVGLVVALEPRAREASIAYRVPTREAAGPSVAEVEQPAAPGRHLTSPGDRLVVRAPAGAAPAPTPVPSSGEFRDGRTKAIAPRSPTAGSSAPELIRTRVTVEDEGETAGSPYPGRSGDLAAMEGAPARPWRDESGERQKITQKEMEVEVKDVEGAHERATSIIEKANGYVQTEELRVDEGERSGAHLVARVPIESLDGVVAQLRELGKVVKLIGESDDRTKEYYARGAQIRELGAKECQLVEEYEKETNRYRRQELYRQIMAIRAQNRQEKEPLVELSDQTHFAFLDLTLTEAGGPGRFLSRVLGKAGTAALWLAVSAIFWVPAMLVLILVWRQVGKRMS
jgi:hypothetical protein